MYEPAAIDNALEELKTPLMNLVGKHVLVHRTTTKC